MRVYKMLDMVFVFVVFLLNGYSKVVVEPNDLLGRASKHWTFP